MGLGREFFQGHVGLLQGLALRAESRVAQARTHVAAFKPTRGCPSGTGTCKTIAATARFGGTPARRIAAVAAVAAVTAVTPLEPTSHGGGFGFFHAGSVVTTHGHHLFGRGRRGRRHSNGRGLGCGLGCGVGD